MQRSPLEKLVRTVDRMVRGKPQQALIEPAASEHTTRLVVLSELQHTLLDDKSEYTEAMSALQELASREIPLSFVSRKTAAEVRFFREQLHNEAPYVVEFGGAIHIPKGYFRQQPMDATEQGEEWVIRLAEPYAVIGRLIREIEEESDIHVVSLGNCEPERIPKLFGLEPDQVELAGRRDFSDILLVEGSESEIETVQECISAKGLDFIRTGRYLQVCQDKQVEAVNRLIRLYRHELGSGLLTIGLGAGESDLPLLESVDHPVLVQKSEGEYDDHVDLPYLSKAKGPSSTGWNEFIRGAIKSDQRLSEYLWFQQNTFHAGDFSDLEKLVQIKRKLGVTISLCLPSLNEEETVGEIISILKAKLQDEVPLLDELILIDSNSTDRTREIAKELGVPVYIHQNTLVEEGSYEGKGEALWKSLSVVKGDIIAWADTDVVNMDPKFVYGTVGALLHKPYLKFAKAYYQRPQSSGDHSQGGGRTTELAARPLFNMLFPELSGIIQPLSGEYAGWRKDLMQVPFFTGYGVETGLLIDIYRKFGLRSMAQVNLDERIHRSQDLTSLSKQAFAVTQVFLKRFMEAHDPATYSEINHSMKMVKTYGDRLYLEDTPIQEYERPPMQEVLDRLELERQNED